MKRVWAIVGLVVVINVGCGPSATGEGEGEPAACPDGQSLCGGFCINPLTDNAFCGAAEDCTGGEACGDGFKCDGTGTCAATCQDDVETCGDDCADTQTDVDHCGDCDTACSGTDICTNGTCCAQGLLGTLDGNCTNVFNDDDNCGAVGNACALGSSCFDGACTCDNPGLALCADACRDVQFDEVHCGGCDAAACDLGEVCIAGSCRTSTDLKIDAVTADNCQVVDHEVVTGDDRGGIALAAGALYYSGDDHTGRLPSGDLAAGVSFGSQVYDGLFTDFRDGRLLSFAVDGVPYNDDTVNDPTLINGIVELDPLTGIVIATTPMSQAAADGTRSGRNNPNAVFAGVGRVALVVNDVFNVIDTLSGDVTVIQGPGIERAQNCENWARWGVLEHFGGEDAVAYATFDPAIVRVYLRDEASEVIQGFSDLSDMCSFTVDPAAQRWVWHYEGTDGELSSGTEEEVAGHCDATVCAFTDACTCGAAHPESCDNGTVCADFQSDPRHCGSCDHACIANALCTEGDCACPAGLPDTCNVGGADTCVNVQTDEQNCGGCGQPCTGPGQECSGGLCACPASAPDTCNVDGVDSCVDLASDEQRCGLCDVACDVGELCGAGVCRAPLPGLSAAIFAHDGLNSVDQLDALTPFTTITTTNFDISSQDGNDNFAFRFTGLVEIAEDGDWTFSTTSDDGSKLFIDGALVVDNDFPHGADERSGEVTLSAGRHDIVVSMFDNGDAQLLEVRFSGPNQPEGLIPDELLTH